MSAKTKIWYFVLQLLTGLISGVVVGSLISYFYKGNLGQTVFISFLAVFVGVIAGVLIPGYVYCQKYEKKDFFSKAVGISIIGLIVFLLIYIVINMLLHNVLPHYFNSIILPILLPLLGAVIGFNLVAMRKIDPPEHIPWV